MEGPTVLTRKMVVTVTRPTTVLQKEVYRIFNAPQQRVIVDKIIPGTDRVIVTYLSEFGGQVLTKNIAERNLGQIILAHERFTYQPSEIELEIFPFVCHIGEEVEVEFTDTNITAVATKNSS